MHRKSGMGMADGTGTTYFAGIATRCISCDKMNSSMCVYVCMCVITCEGKPLYMLQHVGIQSYITLYGPVLCGYFKIFFFL